MPVSGKAFRSLFFSLKLLLWHTTVNSLKKPPVNSCHRIHWCFTRLCLQSFFQSTVRVSAYVSIIEGLILCQIVCGSFVPDALLFHPLDLFFTWLSSQLFNMRSDNLWKRLFLMFGMQDLFSKCKRQHSWGFLICFILVFLNYFSPLFRNLATRNN